MARGFIGYKTYMFKNKDPIIDKYRTALKDSGMTSKQVEEAGGPKARTVENGWFNGKTRRPFFATVAAAGEAIGQELQFVARKKRR